MKPLLRNSLFWKFGLLLVAAVLFTLSFVYNSLYTNRASIAEEVRNVQRYLHGMQRDFNSLLKDTSLVLRLCNDTESRQEFDHLAAKKYGIFLYTVTPEGNLTMNFWNTQQVLPPEETYATPTMDEAMTLKNGIYLVQKQTIRLSSATVVAYALVPIRLTYFSEHEFLPQRFVYSENAGQRIEISQKAVTEFPVKSISGKNLFYLDKKITSGIIYNSRLTIIMRFGGLLLLLLFIHLVADVLAKRKVWKGILFLGVALVTLRVLIYWFPALLNLRQFELFDPSIFGSNIIQRSLGDLLMNSVFFCWLVLFAWYKMQHFKDPIERFPRWLRWTTGIISVCLLIYSTFIVSSVIRSIVADSKISFDVINFWTLNRYTVVGFIVLATLTLSYYYFTQLLFRTIFPVMGKSSWLVYFAIAFSGLVYLTMKSGDPTVLFYIPVLAWLLIYTWLINREGMILTRFRINVAGIMFWIFVFSVSIAAIMLEENKKVEWNKRKFYAEKLTMQTDPSSERLMSIALNYLDKDFFENNFYRFQDSLLSREIRDSILSQNYKVYLEKFDTRLYVYDSSGRSLYNDDGTTYDALNTIVSIQAHPTLNPDLFYYETAFDKFIYITQRTLTDSIGQSLGYAFILSNPRKYSSGEIFPELFRQYRDNSPENSPVYSYAVYDKGQLSDKYTQRYPFPTVLNDKKTWKGNNEFERHINGSFDELWYRAANEKVVIIARKGDTLIETITLFSYLFCAFLFLVFIVQILSLLLKAVSDWDAFKRFFHFNIRNQVHSTIIFISIFSFIIIGISQFNFFKSRYNRNNSDRLSRTMSIMVKEMEKRIDAHSTFDDAIKLYDPLSKHVLEELVLEVSDIHGVDVNVYDLHGDLQVTSEEDVYERGILSKKMDPTAYYHLNRLNQIEHVQEEKIAELPYLSVYAPVRDKSGKPYAYLSIPYFTSQPELNQEISNFIVTIINLNAFILLVAGLIALFITNRITRSFSVITSKMQEVNLGRMNEEISWNRDDEIGDLVTEYNKMVSKLGESAEALAKNEREGAWREMARQVAHEIKNPLTPMKLSIQYLQKAIDSNQPNVKELSGNVARTLVEQIDHLSKIAADFSQFANISYTNVEQFDLHEVINSLQALYTTDPNIDFIWKPVHRTIMINADRTQMNRLFTNLFANAVEACKGRVRIEVYEEVNEKTVTISIRDNGEGIAQEMQSRIFIPNFTTKSSGTGLGLAMCKGIVEQAKGKIWFDTQKGVGTTFFVELPVEEA